MAAATAGSAELMTGLTGLAAFGVTFSTAGPADAAVNKVAAVVEVVGAAVGVVVVTTGVVDAVDGEAGIVVDAGVGDAVDAVAPAVVGEAGCVRLFN